MHETLARMRPSSPLNMHRSVNQGNTRRLWVRLDGNGSGNSGEDENEGGEFKERQLFNQPTYVDIDVRDLVDDVKGRILGKLSRTHWCQNRDNTSVCLGFYYYSAEALNIVNEPSSGALEQQVKGRALIMTYREYQNLIKRNQIRSGRWSQLHSSFSRFIGRAGSAQGSMLDSSRQEAAADDRAHSISPGAVSGAANGRLLPSAEHNNEYVYKVIIEPDMPIMTVYREMFGSIQRSEDALVVFYPKESSYTTPSVGTAMDQQHQQLQQLKISSSSLTNAQMAQAPPSTPIDHRQVLSPATLLDPVHVLTNDAMEQHDKNLKPQPPLARLENEMQLDTTLAPVPIPAPAVLVQDQDQDQDQDQLPLFDGLSLARQNTGILLLPKGVNPEDIENDVMMEMGELKIGQQDGEEDVQQQEHEHEQSLSPHVESHGIGDRMATNHYAFSSETPLTEEEVGLSLSKTLSYQELPKPMSRMTTPSLDKQDELPRYKVFPRINVLIVEDNAINQAILALFLKKNGISYKVAKDGVEAIEKWKEGDSHLILMDLQLPKLSGLEATKRIRELERINEVGLFGHKPKRPKVSPSSSGEKQETDPHHDQNQEQDQDQDFDSDRPNTVELNEDTKLDKSKFRSPVIIVALTASYEQSDRTAALLAGCNDYLTKPVNLDWLGKKLTEWGCMQALIDFDGWNNGQRRMMDNIILRPKLSIARKSQNTSSRSVPRAGSTPIALDHATTN